MEASPPGNIADSLDRAMDHGSSVWTRALELRAAVAQELARQGWRASIDLVGSSSPELELVVDSPDSRARRRWKVPVTRAPVAAQVDRLLGSLRDVHPEPGVRRDSTAERWCAPA